MKRRHLLLLAAAAGAGCGVNNPTYFPPATGPLEAGMMGGAGEATAVVPLLFRAPNDIETAELEARSAELGFRVPWLRRDRVAISVQWSITNLDSAMGQAQILVDGANELNSYDSRALRAAMMMAGGNNNEEATVLALIQGMPMLIPPGQTRTGVIREDDFAEAELDLDAIGRWMAPPPAVLINASEVNPIGMEMVPAGVVVPALVSVSVTLVASRHMRLDFLVRVRDDDNQLLGGGDPAGAFAPMPAVFMPPPPPPPAMAAGQ